MALQSNELPVRGPGKQDRLLWCRGGGPLNANVLSKFLFCDSLKHGTTLFLNPQSFIFSLGLILQMLFNRVGGGGCSKDLPIFAASKTFPEQVFTLKL